MIYGYHGYISVIIINYIKTYSITVWNPGFQKNTENKNIKVKIGENMSSPFFLAQATPTEGFHLKQVSLP
jgi:hypothetical protein